MAKILYTIIDEFDDEAVAFIKKRLEDDTRSLSSKQRDKQKFVSKVLCEMTRLENKLDRISNTALTDIVFTSCEFEEDGRLVLYLTRLDRESVIIFGRFFEEVELGTMPIVSVRYTDERRTFEETLAECFAVNMPRRINKNAVALFIFRKSDNKNDDDVNAYVNFLGFSSLGDPNSVSERKDKVKKEMVEKDCQEDRFSSADEIAEMVDKKIENLNEGTN